MVTKICKKCGEVKSQDEFNKNHLYKDGFRSDCKLCQKVYNKQHRIDNKEDYKEFDSARSLLQERKAWCIAWQRKNRKQNPDKYKARNAVASALRKGLITKANSCDNCGSSLSLEAHHHSYEKEFWLDIRWLCASCHREVHMGDVVTQKEVTCDDRSN